MKKNLSLVFAVLMAATLILSACQPAATPAPTEEVAVLRKPMKCCCTDRSCGCPTD